MLTRLACVLVLASLFAAPASGQDTVTMTGVVVAAAGGPGLEGATLVAGGARVQTGRDGRFSITVPAGPVRLTVSAPGFLDQPLNLRAQQGMPPVEIVMAAATVRQSQTVAVNDSAAASMRPVVDLPPTAVQQVAGAGDNIFKALQTQPGINATDDFGSRLAVRGGGPDQNLTVMDGVEIHNPYRLFGLTSAFNPETIGRFQLTAGGFGVEYGDRLSSILVVENRSGDASRRLTASAAMSLTDANVVFEGKLPGATGAWLVTGRRTYYDLVADRITGNDLPSFGDLQASADWFVAGGRLRLFTLRSRETTAATFTDSGDTIAVGDHSNNDLASVSFTRLVGSSPLESVVSWYDYADDLNVDGNIRSGARRSNRPDDDARARSAIIFSRGLGVRDLAVRSQYLKQTGAHGVKVGLDLHALRTVWTWRITGDRNDQVANGSSVIGGTGLPSELASRTNATRLAAWASDLIRIRPGIEVEPGVRVDRSSVTGKTDVSPRVSTSLQLSSGSRLKTSYGLFTQTPGYEKLLQSDYFVDLSKDAARKLTSERSRHFIVGFERDLTTKTTARVEAYHKTFDDLIIGQLETPEQTAARVAQYDFPTSMQGSVPAEPAITSRPGNGGTGRAFGFDVYLERRDTPVRSKLSGWASYTWGKATLDAYGTRRPFDYDRRHALSVVSTLHVARRLDFGSTLRVASGFPATLPVGLRVASQPSPDNPDRLVPASDASGRPIWTVDFGGVSNLGRGRLPVYARLDLRITFKPVNPSGRWQVYIEILNALNRKNVSQLQPELVYAPASDRPNISYATDSGLPLLPSFGVRWKF